MKKFLLNRINMKIDFSMLFIIPISHPVNSLCISLDAQEALAYSVQIQAQLTFNSSNFLPQFINSISFNIPESTIDSEQKLVIF